MRLGQYGAHEWQFIPTVSFYFGMTASAIEAAVLVVMTRKDPAEKTRMGNCVLDTGLWCGIQTRPKIYTCDLPNVII